MLSLILMSFALLTPAAQASFEQAPFATILEWHRTATESNPLPFSLERVREPQTGRCFTPTGEVFWSMVFEERRLTGPDKGPGFPPTPTMNKIQFWGAWAYQSQNTIEDKTRATKDEYLKSHHMQWMWKHLSGHQFRGPELVWTLDIENNKKVDLEFSMVEHNNFVVLVGKNLVKQNYPVRYTYQSDDYYQYYTQFFGDTRSKPMAVGEPVVACYFYQNMVFGEK